MSVKINKLEIENTKKVKAVTMEPSKNGLTVIGGNNNQGKTSVLDAIAWALGGKRYEPSNAQRIGSTIPPKLRVELSNGLIAERSGKNSDLKVIDPSGNKAGQTLLDSFVEEFALNIPKFMESNNKEKARTLLEIIGVGEELAQLDIEEEKIYQERTLKGREADQKKKYAEELPKYENAPSEIVSASDLIKQQQEILRRNAENEQKRRELAYLKEEKEKFELYLKQYTEKLEEVNKDLEVAQKSALDLHDESTAELEENIQNVEAINVKVRSNLDKEKAIDEATIYKQQYDDLSKKLDEIRNKKMRLLDGADLPLPGLSVEDGNLTFNGQQWDNMSGSEQLKVSTAIVRKLKPDCGFVLIDKLEQMDLDTLTEFGQWLEQEDLQAIATRVSSGDECQIIIEDGYIVGEEETIPFLEDKKENEGWKF